MISLLTSTAVKTISISAAGLLIYKFIWPILKNKIRNRVKKNIESIPTHLQSLIKNDDLRLAITQEILIAQKLLAGKSGQERMERVKTAIRDRFPDIIEDYIVDLVQIIYDELINANLSDKDQ
jgi:hypothetical protein